MNALYAADFAGDAIDAPADLAPTSDGDGAGPLLTIGEAAAELGLKPYVLRFWETRFDALQPLKRGDGRRFYREQDMETLRTLQELLHVRGMTIRGAVQALEEGAPPGRGERGPADQGPARQLQDRVRAAVEGPDFQARDEEDIARLRLEGLLHDLTALKSRLDEVRAA